MVNMYGAGKAFNLRFAQNMFVPGRSLMTPRSSTGTIFGGRPMVQNITVQTTPGGFWGGLMGLSSGFMMGSMIMSGLRGLFGGLFGGGLFGGGMGGLGMGGITPGGCFGTGMPYPAMGGLTGTMPQTITGAGQTQPQTTAQKLANLKTLYPGYNIVAEDDGTFSATKKDKDGNIAEIGTKLSYEDMLDALKADNKTEPQGKPKPETTTAKPEDDPDVNNPNADDPDKVTDDPKVNNPNENGDGKVTDDPAAKNVKGKGNSDTRTGSSTRAGQDFTNWFRYSNDGNSAVEKNIKEAIEASKTDKSKANADAILNTVLKSYGIVRDNVGAEDLNRLRSLMIANNPSVFKFNGEVKDNANWDKLDIPNPNVLNGKYSKAHKNVDVNNIHLKGAICTSEQYMKPSLFVEGRFRHEPVMLEYNYSEKGQNTVVKIRVTPEMNDDQIRAAIKRAIESTPIGSK